MEILHTRKFIRRFLAIFIAIIVVGCRMMAWNEMRIDKIDITDIPIITSEEGARLYLDWAYYEEDEMGVLYLDVSGWCVRLGNETNSVAIRVLIKDTSTFEVYELPTTIIERRDVTTHFSDGNNYDNSGFKVRMECNKFDFEKTQFEVYILYENNENICLIPSYRVVECRMEEY